MPRFRKKPVEIEARQLGVDYDTDCEIVGWCGGTATGDHGYLLGIDTLEGTMYAGPGDWIIQGVQGEFYPCKPDIFELTYESATGAPDNALEALVAACESEFAGDGMDDFDDEDAVAYPTSLISFGMIRRARAAL